MGVTSVSVTTGNSKDSLREGGVACVGVGAGEVGVAYLPVSISKMGVIVKSISPSEEATPSQYLWRRRGLCAFKCTLMRHGFCVCK